MKRRWYLILIVLSIVVVSGIVLYLSVKFITTSLQTITINNDYTLKQYTMKTEKGDLFHIVVKRQMIHVYVSIYYVVGTSKTFVTSLAWQQGESWRPPFTVLGDSSRYRSYDVLGEHVFVIDKQRKTCLDIPYGSLDVTALKTKRKNKDIYVCIFNIAKQKIATKEWIWFDNFAGFLVLNHDKPTIRMVRRYAKGNFTKEEISINSDRSPYTGRPPILKYDVIVRSISLVQKYDL